MPAHLSHRAGNRTHSVADLRLRAAAIEARIERLRTELQAAHQAQEAASRQAIADLKAARRSAWAAERARIDEHLKRQEAELPASQARVRAEQAALAG